MKKIILASTSPRRRQMMALLGLPFKAVDSDYHEVHHEHLKPKELVRFLAEGKAMAVVKKYPNSIVIGSDTIVAHKSKVYGKPHTAEKARQMLRELSGTKHQVITSVVAIDTSSGKKLSRTVASVIHFRKLTDEGIENYIATGEPLDRAGAYAVQDKGAGLIKKIEGDYTSVVGLPLDALREMIEKLT